METKYRQIPTNRATPPGVHIKELIRFRGWSQTELAKRMGRDKTKVSSILCGRLAITDETALQLENVLGMKAEFFMNLQRRYELNLAYIKELDRIGKEQANFLGKIDLKNLVQLKVIDDYLDKRLRIKELLKLFRVNSLEFIQNNQAVAFRSSPKANYNPKVVAVWLQWCQNASESIAIPEYSKSKLIDSLDDLRQLTNSKLEDVFIQIKEILNLSGVGLVLTPMLKNCQVNGAAYLQRANPVIALNDRNKKTDTFWFSLFHEIGHVIFHLNKKNNTIIDDFESNDEEFEREADNFAQNSLFSHEIYTQLKNEFELNPTKETIEKYSTISGINSGILVGRLQANGIIPKNKFNFVRGKFKIGKLLV